MPSFSRIIESRDLQGHLVQPPARYREFTTIPHISQVTLAPYLEDSLSCLPKFTK